MTINVDGLYSYCIPDLTFEYKSGYQLLYCGFIITLGKIKILYQQITH